MGALTTAGKLAVVAVLALSIAWGGRTALRAYQDSRADPRLGDAYILTVDDGDSADDVARRLHRDGMIRSERYFTTKVWLAGGAREPGDHELRRRMSVPEIVDARTQDAG